MKTMVVAGTVFRKHVRLTRKAKFHGAKGFR